MALHTPSITLGMRGTGDWTAGGAIRPTNYRQALLMQYPNGATPLVAITSMMGKESVDDPKFSWFEKGMLEKFGSTTKIYVLESECIKTGTTGTGIAVNTSDAGQRLYVKMAAAKAQIIRAGNQVVLVDEDRIDVIIRTEVIKVVINGANSYIECVMLNDDTEDATYGLMTADAFIVASDINAEGGAMPSPITSSPTTIYNYTQIMRSPIATTRTALRTRLRTKDNYAEAKREAFELHMIDMEWNWIFGYPTENDDPITGQKKRTTGGLFWFAETYSSSNIADYRYETDTAWAGKDWLEGGDDWLDEKLKDYFVYASMNDTFALCGNGAVKGINDLVKYAGWQPLQPRMASYGIMVLEWVTPYGTIYLKPHPLFNITTVMSSVIMVMEPRNLRYRYVDDTYFKADPNMKKGGPVAIDGMQEEWLTEAGLEMHWANTFQVLAGVGQGNSVS